jgi:hypothetical protein
VQENRRQRQPTERSTARRRTLAKVSES